MRSRLAMRQLAICSRSGMNFAHTVNASYMQALRPCSSSSAALPATDAQTRPNSASPSAAPKREPAKPEPNPLPIRAPPNPPTCPPPPKPPPCPLAPPCANASTISPLVRAAALAKTIMVLRNIVGTPFRAAPPPSWSCDGRRICSRTYFDWAVLSRQLEAPRRLIHGRLRPFRSALSRHTRHISSGRAVVVLILGVAIARSNATCSTYRDMLTGRMQHMIDDGLPGGFLP